MIRFLIAVRKIKQRYTDKRFILTYYSTPSSMTFPRRFDQFMEPFTIQWNVTVQRVMSVLEQYSAAESFNQIEIHYSRILRSSWSIGRTISHGGVVCLD